MEGIIWDILWLKWKGQTQVRGAFHPSLLLLLYPPVLGPPST